MAQLSGKERSAYVQEMFDRIAGRYDLINRLISGGQDLKWRRFAAEAAAHPAEGRLLDIATGTGDIAFEALKMSPNALVVGARFRPADDAGRQAQRTARAAGGLDGSRRAAAALRRR